MSPRILVTISRQWKRWSQVREVLSTIHARYPEGVLVHGDHPKCDRIAAGIWKSMGGTDEAWPADWRKYGLAAGPIRNGRMVESDPDLVLAFIRDASPGATGCYDLAKGAGLNCVPPYIDEEGA